MQILKMEQGTPEWFEAKLGIPSASHFSEIITTTGKASTQAKKYMYRLAGEVVSGQSEETYQNAIMLRGIELEAEAKDMYRLINDCEVQEVGFCLENGYGCSPDGLVGEDGGLEIKCPIMSTHVEYLLDNKLPTKYYQQVQGCLAVTGRKWWDFMSYYPGIKPLIIKVHRNEAFISALKNELDKFCLELKQTIERIK